MGWIQIKTLHFAQGKHLKNAHEQSEHKVQKKRSAEQNNPTTSKRATRVPSEVIEAKSQTKNANRKPVRLDRSILSLYRVYGYCASFSLIWISAECKARRESQQAHGPGHAKVLEMVKKAKGDKESLLDKLALAYANKDKSDAEMESYAGLTAIDEESWSSGTTARSGPRMRNWLFRQLNNDPDGFKYGAWRLDIWWQDGGGHSLGVLADKDALSIFDPDSGTFMMKWSDDQGVKKEDAFEDIVKKAGIIGSKGNLIKKARLVCFQN